LVVEGGVVAAVRGAPARADATLRLPSEAFIRLLWGRCDLTSAAERGTVQIEGDREAALALNQVFRGV
jgi:putative sterol carrier protein